MAAPPAAPPQASAGAGGVHLWTPQGHVINTILTACALQGPFLALGPNPQVRKALGILAREHAIRIGGRNLTRDESAGRPSYPARGRFRALYRIMPIRLSEAVCSRTSGSSGFPCVMARHLFGKVD